MKNLFLAMAKFLLYIGASIGVLLVAGVLLFGAFAPSCQEDSEAVAYARSLSQERLTKLYADMETLSTSDSLPIDGFKRHGEELLPPPFSDLKVVKVRPYEANIMVEGCFDHYVYMDFHGFGINKEFYPEPKIVLRWGEHDSVGSEVLWKPE